MSALKAAGQRAAVASASMAVAGTLAWLWPPYHIGPGPGWGSILLIAMLGGWIVDQVLWGLKVGGDRRAR